VQHQQVTEVFQINLKHSIQNFRRSHFTDMFTTNYQMYSQKYISVPQLQLFMVVLREYDRKTAALLKTRLHNVAMTTTKRLFTWSTLSTCQVLQQTWHVQQQIWYTINAQIITRNSFTKKRKSFTKTCHC